MRSHHRTYRVVHGRDGYVLMIRDEWLPAEIVEYGVDYLLKALGHPCCGKGPLSRLAVSYRTLRKVGITYGALPYEEDDDPEEWLDENAFDLFWHQVLNIGCRFHAGRDRRVASLPLTFEQAVAIRPEVADWTFDEDED